MPKPGHKSEQLPLHTRQVKYALETLQSSEWSLSNGGPDGGDVLTSPKGSIYCLFKDSGSKNHTLYSFLEPGSLNGLN